MAEDIKFRHTMPVQIRFSDVDQFGHMNNSVYFSLYDLAKTTYIKDVLAVPTGVSWLLWWPISMQTSLCRYFSRIIW